VVTWPSVGSVCLLVQQGVYQGLDSGFELTKFLARAVVCVYKGSEKI
jgi:hypothetical protein